VLRPHQVVVPCGSYINLAGRKPISRRNYIFPTLYQDSMKDLAIQQPSLRSTTSGGGDGHHHHARSSCSRDPHDAGEAQGATADGVASQRSSSSRRSRSDPFRPRTDQTPHSRRPAVPPTADRFLAAATPLHRRRWKLAGHCLHAPKQRSRKSRRRCHQGFAQRCLGRQRGHRVHGGRERGGTRRPPWRGAPASA
jgi:hypothetical protein